MEDIIGTQKNGGGSVPHADGRLAGQPSGQYGVSDERRAQLSQMEQEAGVQHEAADESVTQQPVKSKEEAAGLVAEPGAARPGDRH